MRRYILIACFILMAATNKKVEQLTLIQKSEFPVVMGDTAQCSYTAELHFFLCGKAIDDSINRYTVRNSLNRSPEAANPLDKKQFELLMKKNWIAFKDEFALVNTELGSAKATHYEKKTRSRLLFKNRKIISYSIDNYYFTGGEHGHQNIFYQVFNRKNGKKIPWSNLISDSAAVTRIAQTVYRQIQMKKGVPEYTAGYFPKGNFYLSNNYYIDKDNLYFHYNTYEIGSFLDGPTTLKIPLKDVKEYMNTTRI